MKNKLLILLLFSIFCNSQQVIQSTNSGSIIGLNSAVSVGEIVVNPVNNLQSNSGIIGILTQINQQTLEVDTFKVNENIVAYPNPTSSILYFKTENLMNEISVSIFNSLGQLIEEKTMNNDNSIDLSSLSSGIYSIQINSKNIKSFKIIKH